MTTLDANPPPSTDSPCCDISSYFFSPSPDCSRFLRWNEDQLDDEDRKAVVFRSLVATVKSQLALDGSLEVKAVKFLKLVVPRNHRSATAYLNSYRRKFGESLTDFVQSIVVLLSTSNRAITKATMKILIILFKWCSAENLLVLVKANLISELINTLNPLSLSFVEAKDIHHCLISTIQRSVWLATQLSLTSLEIKDHDEQQAVRETVLKQVLAPSEKYICHLCVNHYSIVGGNHSKYFIHLLPRLVHISPYYRPTMDFLLNMPVFLTLPSHLLISEDDEFIKYFLNFMTIAQQEWNDQSREEPQMSKTAHRMLRMEGIDDVMEARMRNGQNGYFGSAIVAFSIEWKNMLGMNLPE
ncbi:hypothetical protein BLNAU_20569 [Blattamonas nauphoetae]|uniref:Uncharacterized protein n=1 Tax=Blattamonas nauphoetae TaxID=2049346 RepID=A0ABQ9WYH7_9EUKA|nr:hypothetical protein BLNAU_20569 [Blattamonas nauphoetae]